MQDEFQTFSTTTGFLVEGGQRRDVVLHLGESGLQVEGGPRILWRKAQVKRDDADQALLIIGKSATVGSTDPGFLREIEGAAGNELDQQLARLDGLPTSWRGSQFLGCIAFFGLIGWGFMSMPGCYRDAVDQTVDSLPYSIDVSLGEQAEATMEVGDTIEDEVVVGAIEEMVERLSDHFQNTDVAAEDVEWQIRVVKSDQVNAFALPGGFITVFTGLIEDAESPDMVAGVIGHEMAHVLQRHGIRRVANEIGLFAGLRLILGDTGGVLGLAGEVMKQAAGNNYSQQNESEADALGTKAMLRSGLDPEALADFFLLLKNKYGDVPSGLAWLSTHPGHDTRVEAIRSIIEGMEQPAPEPLDLDWAEVQSRLEKR
ncbi:TPR repeat-containing protein YfgC precursor [Planctomycetes bacterium Poly30]|uniref:TPR repeat-containing protein YfgC n=1 Tax=Saltatorellus ferox TaxID=2528018 RepID=A0A518EV33_9BACT|nr:TPR repeat-containing protein YfgC precursor [Planctomycetes bacterium Poly30]